jgi:hypothetical protein
MRQIRDQEPATGRPQLRELPVPEQSASASSTRHQAWQQSVRIHSTDTALAGFGRAMAKAADSPQSGRGQGLSTSEAEFPNSIGCEPGQPQARQRPRIAVAVTMPIRFLVHIRTM